MMKKLVVIGGGFAGALVAKELQGRFEVTLIDSKDYFEFTPGVLRAIVEQDHLKGIEVCHTDYLNKSKVMMSSVSKVGDSKVNLKNGKKIVFDYLVIASGSDYLSPIKSENIVLANRGRNLAKYHEKLEKAKEIVVIGAGPVGVELAGEIVQTYPGKKLVLIHSREEVLGRNGKKTREYATRFLEERGVELVLGEKVVSHKGNIVKTESGKKFRNDLCILCTGIKPNSEFLEKKFIDKKKFILVNEFLQIPKRENIFVCGDVAAVSEEKTAQNAERQAEVVVKNILALESKRNLQEYKSKKRPMIISLGRNKGILEWNSFILTGRIPSFLKWIVEKKTMLKYKKLF